MDLEIKMAAVLEGLKAEGLPYRWPAKVLEAGGRALQVHPRGPLLCPGASRDPVRRSAMRLPPRKPGFFQKWLFLIALVLLLAPLPALALSASQVFELVRDSVVVIKAFDREGKQVGLGSGVVLPSGQVATNHHVAAAGVRLKVGSKGRLVPATLVAADPERDLALLDAPSLAAVPARLGRTGTLKVGDKVYAVGAPAGLELSLSEGIVSQLRGSPIPLIQTTAAISAGSSGGGLFNDQGELVGLTTFYLKGGQGLNFAVPVDWLTELALSPDRASPRPAGPPPSGDLPSAPEWESRADALLKAKDWPGLLAHCRRWVKAERNNPTAWSCLGVVNGQLGRIREAIDALREALRRKPDDAKPWYNLAIAYAVSGNRVAALQALQELRRLDPQKADELFNRILGR